MIKTLEQKQSKLQITPRENVKDAILKARLKITEESSYAAGNTTEKLMNIESNVEVAVDRGTKLVGRADLGKIGFRTTKDLARGGTLYSELYFVSRTSETIALYC